MDRCLRRIMTAIVFAGMAVPAAGAASLQDALVQLAAERRFELIGAERTVGLEVPENAGAPATRLALLLRDFDYVIITRADGTIRRVVIGSRRAPAEAHQRSHPITAHGVLTDLPRTTAPTPQSESEAGLLASSPIMHAQLASAFGPRRDPILGGPADHHGIDLAARIGTPIRAPAAGTIVEAGWRGGYGRYLRLRHDAMFETAYGHLDRFADGIAIGTRVAQGTIIGYVGATGRVTGPHLHYEILANGTAIDPARIMARALSVPGSNVPGSAASLQTDSPHAPTAWDAGLDAELRRALAIAHLAQRLNMLARRLSPAEPDCATSPCQ
jgi:murein DD-endopeptidase MepM/ murein hydrolase activator NlpD